VSKVGQPPDQPDEHEQGVAAADQKPTDTQISLQGADLVLRTRLALADVPALRGKVVRDARQPFVYRARPADLHAVREVIESRYSVSLAFDPAPPLREAVAVGTPPRPYQQEALAAWQTAGRQGVVVLPTGAGKTLLGALAIATCGVRALVLVPTIDLTLQWQAMLVRALGVDDDHVGVVGGGRREWEQGIVVATYDGAARSLARISGFGLLVADEVHHLPADTYRAIAQAAVAPYRLGLSATLERSDGREADLTALLGETVYRASPETLADEGYLAPFEVRRVWVDLEPDEQTAHDADVAAFEAYRREVRGDRVPMVEFMTRLRKRSVYDRQAREAMLAYSRARLLALNSRAKVARVEELLTRHAAERCIVFAEHVAVVETISRRYLIPAVTSETPRDERAAITAAFRDGRYTKVATGRVWNEGVDVPEASVAIVLAGTGMERETVQRLGRVLRPAVGKQAMLYELVTRDTGEARTADRRRLRAGDGAPREGRSPGLKPHGRERGA